MNWISLRTFKVALKTYWSFNSISYFFMSSFKWFLLKILFKSNRIPKMIFSTSSETYQYFRISIVLLFNWIFSKGKHLLKSISLKHEGYSVWVELFFYLEEMPIYFPSSKNWFFWTLQNLIKLMMELFLPTNLNYLSLTKFKKPIPYNVKMKINISS